MSPVGELEGGSLQVTMRDGRRGLEKYVKERFWQRATLSIGAPLGNLEGGILPGTSRYGNILAPFLDPDYVRRLSLGAIWNFCEGPGLS